MYVLLFTVFDTLLRAVNHAEQCSFCSWLILTFQNLTNYIYLQD